MVLGENGDKTHKTCVTFGDDNKPRAKKGNNLA